MTTTCPAGREERQGSHLSHHCLEQSFPSWCRWKTHGNTSPWLGAPLPARGASLPIPMSSDLL